MLQEHKCLYDYEDGAPEEDDEQEGGLFFMNALEEKFRDKLARSIAPVLKAHEPSMRFCKQSLEKSISLLRPAK